VTDRNRHLGVLARVALLVSLGDWLTKTVATRLVDGEVVLTERLRLAVLHNDAAAFGLSVGTYTWQLNLAVTMAAIAFMIPVSRDLARIDAAAPRALGLIMGGALGNLASLIFSPHGVVDFISIGVGAGRELAFNLADMAAYIGLAMVVRTAFLIVAELRRSARPLPMTLVDVPGVRAWRAPGAEAGFPLVADREVPVPVVQGDLAEPVDGDDPTPRPESVRQAALSEVISVDPKVIDIRPRLALARQDWHGRTQRAD
jgi:lipoprotein signal peptidase